MITPKSRRIRLFALLLGILGATSSVVYISDGTRTTQLPETDPSIFEISESDLVVAVERPRVLSIRVSGVLKPIRKAMLISEVEGRIATVNVRVGDRISAGEELARLDLKDLDRRLSIEHSNLLIAKSQLDSAELTNRRNSDLVANGFISSSAADSSKNALNIAKETLKSREAQYALARQAVSKGTIVAPLSGVVEERLINPGQFVATNAPLFSVVDLSEFELVAEVPSASIELIRPGIQVDVSIEGSQKIRSGRIDRVAPSANMVSRMIPIFIRVTNDVEAQLPSGLTATGTIFIPQGGNGTFISEQAIRDDHGVQYILLATGDQIIRRNVSLGVRDHSAGLVEVASDLNPGERALLAKVTPPKGNFIVKVFTYPNSTRSAI